MANSLPDEILSEILSPALKVSDVAFSDLSRDSPFAAYSESSSAALLVSKSWLRVATPLLYHVVVLRSKAQASALEIVLRQNPDLGRFIKKLRVEGAYGGSMLKIISRAPNVTDLCISLNIWSSDNVSGLCRGLPSMKPTRVVLVHSSYHSLNKNQQLLLDTLKKCIKEWPNLTVFEMPYPNPYYGMATNLASMLSEAPHLKTVVIPPARFGPTPPEHLRLLAKSASLQNIQIKGPNDYRPDLMRDMYTANAVAIAHPSLRGLIKIPEEPVSFPLIAANPNPSSTSSQFSTTAVTEDIWKHILSYAMMLDIEITHSKSKPRLGIVLVSKMFARLALPYLIGSLVFRNPSTFDHYLDTLRSNPALGSQLKTLYLDTTASLDLRPILSRTKLVNIIGLTPGIMTLKALNDLGKYSGSTLVRLEGLQVKSSKLEDPSLFSLFPRVRSLSLGLKVSFNTTSTSIPSSALASLEQITVSNFEVSLIVILSEMDLPALRHAMFPHEKVDLTPFLRKHGTKLQTLSVYLRFPRLIVFDLCPALVDLIVICGPLVPHSSTFVPVAAHTSLETITFKIDVRVRGAERKWGPFLKSFSASPFPALRQISLPCIVWPTTEHDIGKSSWVKCAEELLDRNVKLVDAKGVGWRRRLKK
ncbi:hypothetical protein C8R43DRAFT_946501 [Mycena crocata]|nr:hypothetical protein C8R43DRAFT_946501 [Mycena crocata]